MDQIDFLTDARVEASRISRARVVRLLDDGTVSVTGRAEETELLCDVLETSGQATRLEAGDQVLVWRPQDEEERGVVLGRIGRAASPADAGLPDEIVVEAGKKLTIRCGAGAITLREDGKVLIKGIDLVSHAKRTNRVKGGSVGIN
jgi:hypothetical protein